MRFPKAMTLSCAALFLAGAARASDRALTSIGGRLMPQPPGDAGLLFVVGGDNRPTGKGAPIPRVTRTIFDEIGLIRPDFVFWTGDALYGYGDTPAELAREYQQFESLAVIAGVPLFNAPGNHEIHRTDDSLCSSPQSIAAPDSETQFVRHFGNLYGSFDAGRAHFIALNTAAFCHEDKIDGAQLEWLKRDLEANKNAAAIFVFGHTEWFSSPQIDAPAADGHEALRNRDELHALFRKYPVKAVFSGHEHLYWRESHDGIDYFIAGGGGAPLYASPDRGGFSHYIVVQLSDGGVAYDVVQPGHLSVEDAGRAAGAKKIWVVNSNDADIPLRGVSLDASRIGPCPAIRVRSDLRRRDGTPVPIPVSKLSCSGSKGGSRLRLGLIAPAGTSVPILLQK
jgi:hypothetical protein